MSNYLDHERPLHNVECVLSHSVNDKGDWSFLLKFSDGDEFLIPDTDCYCESLIKEYLSKLTVPTYYCISRVSNNNTDVSLDTQKYNLSTFVKPSDKLRVKHISLVKSVYRGVPREIRKVATESTGGDVIVVYRVDRLARNVTKFTALLEEISTKGVRIYSFSEQLWYHENKVDFVEKIIQANRESKTISDRVKVSVAYRRARGDECLGSPGYGFKLKKRNGKIVKVSIPEEKEVIDMIVHDLKCESVRDIIRILENQGITNRGKKWTRPMVRRLIKRFR
jgi:DNA invertase Pin-like site-specific DNA recombinase